jgi:hypothetical protein
MTGILAGVSQPSSLTFTLTVGISTVAIGKDSTISAIGYVTGDPLFGSFGSVIPATYLGFSIIGIYMYDYALQTIFWVVGDASAQLPVMTIDGAAQNLGPGAFDGANTTWSSAIATPNPFVPATVTVSIS